LVTSRDGRTGLFTEGGVWINGDLGEADPHMCQWLAGKQLEADDELWRKRRGDILPADTNGSDEIVEAESAAEEMDKRMEQMAAMPSNDASVREIGAAAIRDG
ncbi:MAG TPA: hypothetical protein DGL25_03815, partial [Dehalococcoidia bacterium]|nr:hypothetical protein [Dehalococcoidia bacterium]